MSSILKALQKLDSDAGVKAEPGPLSRRIDTRRLLGPRRARSRFRLLPAVLMAGCLLLAGLAIVWVHGGFWGTRGLEQPRPAPSAGAGQQGGLIVADRQPEKPESDQQDTAASLGKGPEQTTGVNRQPMPPGGDLPAISREAPMATSQPAPAPGRQVEMDKPGTGSMTEEPGEKPTPARVRPGGERTAGSSSPGAASRPKPVEKRLDASVLALQAITWSTDPDGRFALIDNQIVRRGDAVSGYAIVEIFEQYVLVAKGGDTWRVEFRHHSP